MSDRPSGDDLLGVGRRALLDDLLPLLPADKIYQALMVANAMAIAGRELKDAGHASSLRQGQIAAFYRDAGLQNLRAAHDIERDLAQKIRQGEIPRGRNDVLLALLLSAARERLSISNPRRLQEEG